MRQFLLMLFGLFLGQCGFTQEMINLYEDISSEGIERLNPESKTTGGVTRLSNVVNPRLQVFKPTDALNNGKAMIVCPGGGYQILAIDLEGIEIAEWLTSLGFTAYVLEYRVPKQREAAKKDLMEAIRTVRELMGEEVKLGVLGFSAGGHLTAAVATSEELTRPVDLAVLIYPAYLDQGPDGALSPEITLTPETPPMFIFVAADDKYANSSIVMAGALQRNQTSVEFHMLPEGGHGYGMRTGKIAAETWPVLLDKWLKNK